MVSEGTLEVAEESKITLDCKDNEEEQVNKPEISSTEGFSNEDKENRQEAGNNLTGKQNYGEQTYRNEKKATRNLNIFRLERIERTVKLFAAKNLPTKSDEVTMKNEEKTEHNKLNDSEPSSNSSEGNLGSDPKQDSTKTDQIYLTSPQVSQKTIKPSNTNDVDTQPDEEVPSPAKEIPQDTKSDSKEPSTLVDDESAEEVKQNVRTEQRPSGNLFSNFKGLLQRQSSMKPTKSSSEEVPNAKRTTTAMLNFEEPEELEVKLIDMSFPLSVDEFNQVFFQDDTFQKQLFKTAKYTNIKFEPWSDKSAPGSKQECSYKMKRMGMASNTVYISLEYKQAEPKKGYQVNQVVTTPEVPYGNCFKVHVRTIIQAKEENVVNIKISQNVELVGRVSAIARNFIRKMSRSESIKYYDTTWKPFIRNNLMKLAGKNGTQIMAEEEAETSQASCSSMLSLTKTEVLLTVIALFQLSSVILLMMLYIDRQHCA